MIAKPPERQEIIESKDREMPLRHRITASTLRSVPLPPNMLAQEGLGDPGLKRDMTTTWTAGESQIEWYMRPGCQDPGCVDNIADMSNCHISIMKQWSSRLQRETPGVYVGGVKDS